MMPVKLIIQALKNQNKNDKITTFIRDFNSYIKNDKKTEKVMMPIGDGLTVCRKL